MPLSLGLNRIAALSLPLAVLTLAAFAVLAAWLCDMGESLFGEKDCRKIVIDEIAGFLLAGFLSPGLGLTAAAFLLFRFFDIIKPYPASRAERLPGGLGVIMDDLLAGLYTFLSLRLLIFGGFL